MTKPCTNELTIDFEFTMEPLNNGHMGGGGGEDFCPL